MKIDSVGRETGRPVDRGERIGPVSLVSWFPGVPGYRPRFSSVSALASQPLDCYENKIWRTQMTQIEMDKRR